jgi:predicted ATPase
MHIKSISIQNFKSLKKLEIDNLPKLVVIAGPNGTGKSSVLDAINVWKQAVRKYQTNNWFNNNQIAKLIRKGETYSKIEIEIVYSEDDVRYLESLGQRNNVKINDKEKVFVRIESNGSFRVEGARSNALYYLLSYPDRENYPNAGIFDYYGPHRFLPSKEFTSFNTNILKPEQEQRRRIQPSFKIQRKSDVLKDYLYMLNQQDLQWFANKRKELGNEGQINLDNAPNSFEEIRNLIKELLPHLKFKEVKQDSTIKFLFEVPGGSSVDLDELSSGEKEVLSLFLEIDRMQLKNSIILIDEPELHLNQSVESRIVPFVQKNIVSKSDNQVFIVSHSPGILAGTPDENLYRINYNKNGNNQISKITTDDDRINTLKNIVGDLGVFTTSDRFIFLEGTNSSQSFDKEILETLFPKLKNEVSFIPSGSYLNVELVSKKVQHILEEDIPFGNFYAIRDRDRLTDEKIQKLETDIPNLKVWPRCMIENFFLDSEILKKSLKNFNINLSETEVSKALKEAGENIINKEIDLRINDYMINKIVFKDFTDHPDFGTVDKLNKAKGKIEEEIDKFENLKNNLERKAREELDSGDYLKTFHGKRLFKEFKRIKDISISDELFIPYIANVMKENELIPDDLKAVISTLLE